MNKKTCRYTRPHGSVLYTIVTHWILWYPHLRWDGPWGLSPTQNGCFYCFALYHGCGSYFWTSSGLAWTSWWSLAMKLVRAPNVVGRGFCCVANDFVYSKSGRSQSFLFMGSIVLWKQGVATHSWSFPRNESQAKHLSSHPARVGCVCVCECPDKLKVWPSAWLFC